MVISAPPATVPPAALLPAAHVAAANPAPHGWTTYRVRPGDTLVGIAARFRTTVGAFAARNHVRNPRAAHGGHACSACRAPRPPRRPPRARGPPRRCYVVRSGDTLSGIATRFRVPLASLLKANHLSARSFIQPGQRIVVRAAAGKAAAPRSRPRPRAYRVRAGDTLELDRRAPPHDDRRHRPGQQDLQPGPDPPRPGAPGARQGQVEHRAARCPTPSTAHKYPRAVAEAAAHNRAILARRSVPSRSETRAMIVRIARQQGVDTRLALAIAYQESGWNQRAVSPANAVGVMQVIPQGGQWAVGPGRAPARPAQAKRQHHRRRGHAALAGPLHEQHGEDRRGLLPGARRAAEARHVQRHQAVRAQRHAALRSTM